MHQRPRPRLRPGTLAALCLTAAAAATLTACGGDKGDKGDSTPWNSAKNSERRDDKPDKPDKPKGPFPGMSGPDIVDKSVSATTAAKSLTIKGSAPDGEGGVITMDIALNTRGECTGSMSVAGEGSIDLIMNRTTVYMRPDAEFIRSETKGQPEAETSAAVQMMANRWSKMSATSPDAKDMAAFCDLDTILAEFNDVDSAARRGKVTPLDGAPALALHEHDGKDRYTIYVATQGKPYLRKIVNNAKPSETLTFTDYDKPVKTTPPTGDVLDLDKLAG
ncbi:lipoprotein [Streptomyces aureoverticillatus]|nr:lipoprotein [Streptomyces aureoverticillatus]